MKHAASVSQKCRKERKRIGMKKDAGIPDASAFHVLCHITSQCAPTAEELPFDQPWLSTHLRPFILFVVRCRNVKASSTVLSVSGNDLQRFYRRSRKNLQQIRQCAVTLFSDMQSAIECSIVRDIFVSTIK